MPLNSTTPDTQPPEGAGCLSVVATPIGNLEDITLRALKILARADLIAAEDTRHTRRLLAAHDIHNKLISYHEHNEQRRSIELLERMARGEHIALVTDAGTPMVSDPGYRLVQATIARGIAVVPIPGVSAAIAGLSAAGLATDNFTFVGFPDRKKARRLKQLKDLASLPHTVIFYQSPRRILSFLEELKTVFGDRPAVLARELTKIHEEFIRGPISEIIAALEARGQVKGECTLLISGAVAVQPTEKDLDQAIKEALADQDRPLSEIAKVLARRFDIPRKQIYNMALRIKENDQ